MSNNERSLGVRIVLDEGDYDPTRLKEVFTVEEALSCCSKEAVVRVLRFALEAAEEK